MLYQGIIEKQMLQIFTNEKSGEMSQIFIGNKCKVQRSQPTTK